MTLDGIKKAVSKYGTFPMFHHGGYVMEDATFHFKDPASPQEISDIEQKLGVTFLMTIKSFCYSTMGWKCLMGLKYLA